MFTKFDLIRLIISVSLIGYALISVDTDKHNRSIASSDERINTFVNSLK